MLSTQTKIHRQDATSSVSPAITTFKIPQEVMRLPQINRDTIADITIRKPSKQNSTPLITDKRVKATDAQYRQAYADGLNTVQAGKRLGVSHTTVSVTWAFFDLPIDAKIHKVSDQVLDDARKRGHSAELTGKLAHIAPEVVIRRWKIMDAKLPEWILKWEVGLRRAHKKKLTTTEAGTIIGLDRSTVSKGWKILGLTVPKGRKRTKRLGRCLNGVPEQQLATLPVKKIPTEVQLRDAFERKLSSRAAAKELDTKYRYVLDGWKALDLKPPAKAKPPRPENKLSVEQLKFAHQKKLTVDQASVELGVSSGTISRGWYALNLEPHHPNGRTGRPRTLLRR